MNNAPAIVILGPGSLATAQRVQQCYPQAVIHGLQGRVEGADRYYAAFGDTLRALYQQDTPIIALCAAGIVIRTLAPLLNEKGVEPPVLAVAEDGSAVVPLLGGLGGVNVMAREIGEVLGVNAAITTSGELRFGTCLLNPPEGYALADLEQGKRFVSDLLAGEAVRVEGDAPWLEHAQLPASDDAQRTIHVGSALRPASRDELLIHARCVVVAVTVGAPDLVQQVREELLRANIAEPALACLLASEGEMAEPALHEAAQALNVALRFVPAAESLEQMLADALPQACVGSSTGLAHAVTVAPVDVERIGRRRGRLAVIGLGPAQPS